MNFKDDERYKLMHEWALHFGYYDGRIDITAGDSLEAFTTHDAGLVANAPLWGTKPGKEVLVPVQQVSANLAKFCVGLTFTDMTCTSPCILMESHSAYSSLQRLGLN